METQQQESRTQQQQEMEIGSQQSCDSSLSEETIDLDQEDEFTCSTCSTSYETSSVSSNSRALSSSRISSASSDSSQNSNITTSTDLSETNHLNIFEPVKEVSAVRIDKWVEEQKRECSRESD